MLASKAIGGYVFKFDGNYRCERGFDFHVGFDEKDAKLTIRCRPAEGHEFSQNDTSNAASTNDIK